MQTFEYINNYGILSLMYEKLFHLQEEVFKVLANQKRLEIIQLLAERELCVSDMIDMLGLPQANLSQHLAQMRRSGLLKVTKQGTRVYYRLNDQKIAEAVFNVRDFLLNTQQLDKKLHHYLEKSANLYPVATDAVCGMRLSTVRSSYHVDYDGQSYFFCASGCKEKFLETPTRYALRAEGINGD